MNAELLSRCCFLVAMAAFTYFAVSESFARWLNGEE